MDTQTPPPEGLKLRALDVEDLTVLAAFLQDAIANVSEMAYLPEERRFVLAVCRFRWELVLKDDGDAEAAFRRVSCVVSVDGVGEPKYRGFSLKDRGRTMELLTVIFAEGAVTFTFAGGAAIKLGVDSLDLRLEDFGECWPAQQKPAHESLSA